MAKSFTHKSYITVTNDQIEGILLFVYININNTSVRASGLYCRTKHGIELFFLVGCLTIWFSWVRIPIPFFHCGALQYNKQYLSDLRQLWNQCSKLIKRFKCNYMFTIFLDFLTLYQHLLWLQSFCKWSSQHIELTQTVYFAFDKYFRRLKVNVREGFTERDNGPKSTKNG